MRPVLLLMPLACLFLLTAHADGQGQDRAPARAPAPAPAPAPDPLAVLKDRPDAPPAQGSDGAGAAAQPLGEPFRSQALGVSLRPPAGFKTVRKLGGEEVSFVDETGKWTLKVTRMQLTDRMGLEPGTDPKSNLSRAGLLEVTL